MPSSHFSVAVPDHHVPAVVVLDLQFLNFWTGRTWRMVLPWRFYSCVKPGIYKSRKSGRLANAFTTAIRLAKVTSKPEEVNREVYHLGWQKECLGQDVSPDETWVRSGWMWFRRRLRNQA